MIISETIRAFTVRKKGILEADVYEEKKETYYVVLIAV